MCKQCDKHNLGVKLAEAEQRSPIDPERGGDGTPGEVTHTLREMADKANHFLESHPRVECH